MRYVILFLVGILVSINLTCPAAAEFMVSSAIIEFTADSPQQKDINLTSRGKESDYIVAEIYKVLNPDEPSETRQLIDDASTGGLLVTPDKTVLAPSASRLMRFVLTKGVDDEEHIYRVAVKPVIKGLQNNTKVGLKVLVGYEVLVIVRPAHMTFKYTAQRQGKMFTVTNHGNTNILFESGQQCPSDQGCAMPPVIRVYPGQTKTVELPLDKPIDYAVWNGESTATEHYN